MIYLRKLSLILILSILLVCIFTSTGFGQNTVSVDLQVDATAINRFIASQTFPTLTGSVSGNTYSISITTPVVKLSPGSATVQFTILANTSAGNYSFTVNPTFTIPNLSVSLTQVVAEIQQFDVLINSMTNIPSWLQPIIISGYNNLNLMVYPSKMLDYANSAVPAFMSIQVTNIAISFAVIQGALDFTIAATVLGTPPVFTAQWLTNGNYINIEFGANIATTATQVVVFNSIGQKIYENTNLNLSIPKGGVSTAFNATMNASTGVYYYIQVLFDSPYGEFARDFEFTFWPTPIWTWTSITQQTTPSIN
jgi:hypothetical protein